MSTHANPCGDATTWYDDAYWPSESDGQVKFWPFENPRCRMAAIMKYQKAGISRQWFDQSAWHLSWWHKLGLRIGRTDKSLNSWKTMTADGSHLEKSKIGHISTTDWPVTTKFVTVMLISHFNPIKIWNFKNSMWQTATIWMQLVSRSVQSFLHSTYRHTDHHYMWHL